MQSGNYLFLKSDPGNIAVLDEGYLDITGRIKDMVIRGGENVYPREIEEFLYQHQSIKCTNSWRA